jgi:predicted Holliday junction resolvase-like endonuclease
MKQFVYIIIGALVVLLVALQRNEIRRLKNQIEVDKLMFENKLRAEVIRTEMRTTDSLIEHYNNLPPLTEVKTQIRYRYETKIDTIYLLPDSLKWEWISAELSRIYPTRPNH